MKIHFHRLDAQAGSRDLGLHAQGNPFVRLNAHDQHILVKSDRFLVEQDSRRFLEVDGNFRAGFRETLAHAQVNRHIGKAPVINVQAQRDEGFDHGGRIHVLLFAITGDRFSADGAGGILAAHGPARYFRARHAAQRAHDLDFLIADGVRAQVGGRFHADEAEELQKMILHHVAQSTRALVIAGASFHSERFRGRDLNMIDVTRVPERLEDGVGETQY